MNNPYPRTKTTMDANLHKEIIPGRFNAVALVWGQIALVGVLAAAPAGGVLELRAISDFTVSRKVPYVPAYKDGNNQALAIDAAQHKNQFAAGEVVFPGPSGTYDVVITTLTETDGESTYQLFVQGKKLGEFQNPKTDEDYIPAQHRWKNVALQQGDEVLVAFNTHSNGRTPEGSGFAFARGQGSVRRLEAGQPRAAALRLVPKGHLGRLALHGRVSLPDRPGKRCAQLLQR